MADLNTNKEELDRAMSRVRKMMALANDASASEGERDNALRMAHNTLAKYNMTLAEAESAGQTVETRINAVMETGNDPWIRTVVSAIAHLFFCHMFYVRSGKGVKNYFVGRAGNVATAQEMARYVVDSIIRQSRREAPASKAGAWKLSFRKGASHQVYIRCQELRREAERASQTVKTPGTSLVLASFYASELAANKRYIAEQMGMKLRHSVSRERNAGAGYGEGSAYGKNINLNRQLGGSNGPKQLR